MEPNFTWLGDQQTGEAFTQQLGGARCAWCGRSHRSWEWFIASLDTRFIWWVRISGEWVRVIPMIYQAVGIRQSSKQS